MGQSRSPAFLPEAPEGNHQLEEAADQGAKAEPTGFIHVVRGEVLTEDAQSDDHAEVQHPRGDLRQAEASGKIDRGREQGRDADERHVGHADRGQHRRFGSSRRSEIKGQGRADADQRQADHPREYLAEDEIEEAERGELTVLDGFVRQHRHDGRGERAFAEQPSEEVRYLEGDDERRADGGGAEDRGDQLIAEQPEDARDHRPGGGLRHGLVLARLLGHDLRAGWRACLLRARHEGPGRGRSAGLPLRSGPRGCGPWRRPWPLRCRRRRAHTSSRRLRRPG